MSENLSTIAPISPPLDLEGNPIHCVRIYIGGPKNETAVAKVLFSDKDSKQKYIKAEYKFCKDAEDAYLAARFINQREKTKAELYAKRVTFAKQQNYVPKRGNKLVWIQENKDAGGRVA